MVTGTDPTDYIAFPASTVPNEMEIAYMAHLLTGSYRVGVGSTVTPTSVLAQAGAFAHVHFSVNDELSNIATTTPSVFFDYDVSRDYGLTWNHVALGVPRFGEWVRRPLRWCPCSTCAASRCSTRRRSPGLHCLDQ